MKKSPPDPNNNNNADICNTQTFPPKRMLKALTKLKVHNKCSIILQYSFHEMCFQFALEDVNRLSWIGEFRNIFKFYAYIVLDNRKACRSLPNLATTNVCKVNTSNRSHIERSRWMEKHPLIWIHYDTGLLIREVCSIKGLSHWWRRHRDWSVAATRATRETKKWLAISPRRRQGDVWDKWWRPWPDLVPDLDQEWRRLGDASTRSVTWSLKWVNQRRQRRRDFAATSPQSSWSPAGLRSRAQKSPRRCRNWWRRRRDVSETCWRLEKVYLKKWTCLNFSRLPGDPASLQETSQRRLCNQRRLESPPGRHLVSRPMR